MGGSATGLLTGLTDLMSSVAGIDTTPPAQPHGLRMNGEYKAANGMDLNFTVGRGVNGVSTSDITVTLSGCGQLVSQTVGYTMTPRGTGYILQLATSPKPVLVAFNPGAQVVGSGAAQIAGQVITGYNIITHSKRYSDGTIVPGSAYTEKVPVYGPASAVCAFGAFQVIPQHYVKQLANSVQWFGNNDLAGTPIPNGAFMSGIYAAQGAGKPGAIRPGGSPTGLRAEFSVNNVIVDCGQAHMLAQYSLRDSGGQVSVSVANDKSPFTLLLKPDGSLVGSGAVQINGRLFTGEDGRGGYSFKPVSATCNVGTLAVY